MDDLIRPEKDPGKREPVGQPYGDLTALNTRRLVLDAVGKKALADIMRDYLALLDSSSAVYEANGDYAQGIFASGWCRKLDSASRHLCGTEDNRAALQSGQWHCHESCWNTSKASMETSQPSDLPCRGGIRIYAVPIHAGGKVVGAANFGYGDPPQDPKALQEIAERYGLAVEDLRALAAAYKSQPADVIERAKNRLAASARLIGSVIESRQAEKKFRDLFECSPDALVIVNKDGAIMMLNASAETMFGYTRGELIGQPIEVLIPERLRSGHVQHRDDFFANPHRRPMGVGRDLPSRRKDGAEFSAEISLSPMQSEDGLLVISTIRDITERKLVEAERARLHERLNDSHEQLRALAKRLLEVQEEERRLLARELHDEIGQQLTALKLNIQVLQSATDPARAAARFTDCIGIADHLLDVVRACSLNLRPPLLDELGLGPSLESFVRIQAQRAELAVDLAIEPNVPRLPALLEITAFRIVQESLTNVIRHAQAARVAIAVQSTPEGLALTIRDDGRGFDIHAMREQTNTGWHTGLPGLRERVKLLGGRFVVESAPGRGTEVRVTLPLEPAS